MPASRKSKSQFSIVDTKANGNATSVRRRDTKTTARPQVQAGGVLKKAKTNTKAKASAMKGSIPTNTTEETEKENGVANDTSPIFFFGAKKPNGFLSQFYTFPRPLSTTVTVAIPIMNDTDQSTAEDVSAADTSTVNRVGSQQEVKVTFTCAEQFMMYHKAITFSDHEVAEKILTATNPVVMKRLGRQVKGYDEQIWRDVRYDVVVRGNMLKFGGGGDVGQEQEQGENEAGDENGSQTGNKSLREMLLATGDRELIEASPWDKTWGIGYTAEKARSVGREKWGQNLLGKALMEVRRRLREMEMKKQE